MPTTSRESLGRTNSPPPERTEAAELAAQMALALGLSANTGAAYRRDVSIFATFLSQPQRGRGLLDATRRDVLDFSAAERDRRLAPTTLSRRLMALRTFYGWLVGEGAVRNNPTEAIERPKLPRHLPDCLTEEQAAAIVSAFDGDKPLDLRNRAMMELLYACGLRASELISLRLDDVNLPEAMLRCIGKGSKERVVPIGQSAIAAIVRYLETGRPALDKERGAVCLFLSSKGGKPLTRQMLWNIVVEAAKKAGIWGHVHPHTLRHCFASHLLSHGAGIRPIQEMLGHADIATTQIYTHVDVERVLDVHRKFHPRR